MQDVMHVFDGSTNGDNIKACVTRMLEEWEFIGSVINVGKKFERHAKEVESFTCWASGQPESTKRLHRAELIWELAFVHIWCLLDAFLEEVSLLWLASSFRDGVGDPRVDKKHKELNSGSIKCRLSKLSKMTGMDLLRETPQTPLETLAAGERFRHSLVHRFGEIKKQDLDNEMLRTQGLEVGERVVVSHESFKSFLRQFRMMVASVVAQAGDAQKAAVAARGQAATPSSPTSRIRGIVAS